MLDEFVKEFGAAYHNMALYGTQHPVTISKMESSFEALVGFLQGGVGLTFTVTDDAFLVNNDPYDTRAGVIGQLVEQLRAFRVSTLSFGTDVSPDDFVAVFSLLTKTPEDVASVGDFADVLTQAGVTTIQSKKVTYVQVDDDETVISKDDIRGMVAEELAAQQEQIVGFLSGTGPAGEGGGLGGSGATLKDLSEDAGHFGEMIVMAAAEAPGQPGVAPEDETPLDFIHKVVHCLRRAFEALMEDPAFKTQKGKKDLGKTLKTLEEELVSQLKDSGVEFSDDDLSGISEAVEDMSDEVKIDSLASEYMKKRKAIDASEVRLMRYIKRKADHLEDGVLREKLMDGGLSSEGWADLLVESGVVDPAMSPEEVAAQFQGEGVARLGGMLGKLDEEFRAARDSGAAESEEEVRKLIATVEKEVSKLVDRTETKIENIASIIQEADSDQSTAGKSGGMTKKKMIEMLAEVVQELCQPLVVINTTITMMSAGNLGEVTDTQKSMLDLAFESAERMQYLIDEIGKVSGTPDSLSPDLEGVGLKASVDGGPIEE